jgi:hypothetical protein
VTYGINVCMRAFGGMFPTGHDCTRPFEVPRVHGFVPLVLPAAAADHATRHKDETTKCLTIVLKRSHLRGGLGGTLAILACRRHGGMTLNWLVHMTWYRNACRRYLRSAQDSHVDRFGNPVLLEKDLATLEFGTSKFRASLQLENHPQIALEVAKVTLSFAWRVAMSHAKCETPGGGILRECERQNAMRVEYQLDVMAGNRSPSARDRHAHGKAVNVDTVAEIGFDCGDGHPGQNDA